jgi:hypothetical protein
LPVDQPVDGVEVVFASGDEGGVEKTLEKLDGEDVPVQAEGGAENEGRHGEGAEEESCAVPRAEYEEKADRGFEADSG